MSEVVARLRLYMSYTVDGTFHRNVLYGTSLPISADLLDVDENVGAGFTVSEKGGSVTLNDSSIRMRRSAASRSWDTTATRSRLLSEGSSFRRRRTTPGRR